MRNIELEVPQEEVKEGESEKFEKELIDKNGDVIGHLSFELGPKQMFKFRKEERLVRPLISLKLRGLGDTDEIVDVFEKFVSPGTKIYLDESPKRDYYCVNRGESSSSEVVAPFINNQLDLAILFHELGHAEQFYKGEMSDLNNCVKGRKEFELFDDGSIYSLLELQKVSSLRGVIDLPDDSEINILISEITVLIQLRNQVEIFWEKASSLMDKFLELDVQIEELEIKNEEGSGEIEQQILFLKAQRDRVDRDYKKAITAYKKNKKEVKRLVGVIKKIVVDMKLLEIFKVVSIAIENHASAKAENWMQEMEDKGINIFAPVKVKKNSVYYDPKSDSGEEIIVDPLLVLKHSLFTYCG